MSADYHLCQKEPGMHWKELSETGAQGLGIDWCITPQLARELTGNKITLQGNFDPAKLLSPIPEIKKEVKK